MATIPQELVGTIPGWITSAGVIAILGLVVRWQLGLKRLAVQAKEVEVHAQQTINADEADIRDHYAQEVKRLRDSLHAMETHYRNMLKESDRRHAECEAARQEMRAEMEAMRDEINGLKRQVPAVSADKLLILEESTGKPGEVAPHSVAAAKRINTGNGK